MAALLMPIRWLFTPQAFPGAGRSILWWEARRIPVNLLLAIYGFFCFFIFLWGVCTSGALQPGQDPIEPAALLLAPIAFNLCYTLGWLVEAPAHLIAPDLRPRFGPLLLKLGLGFSLFVITLPAALWGGYRTLQIVGIMK